MPGMLKIMNTSPNLPRRRFLQMGAMAGLPMVLPSRLFGENAPSRTLHVGIIGCGDRFRAMTADFTRISGVRVVAICDLWPERREYAKGFVDEHNDDTHCKMYADHRELIADPEVDIVGVAAPDHWHSLMAIEAARRGKHIYLEKPFAYSIEEGRAIIEAVHSHGVLVQHGTQQRSTSHFQRATWLARHGYLGNVEKVYAISPVGITGGDASDTEMPDGFDYDQFTGPAPETPFYRELILRPNTTSGWYFTSPFGGGWITAWGSHHVDSAQMAIGKDHEAPVRVEATGRFPTTGVFDTCDSWYAEMTYADGKKIIYLTDDRPECPQLERANIVVVGDEGWVAANRGRSWSNPPSLLERAWPKDPTLPQLERGSQAEHFRNFIDAIRDGVPLTSPMEPGHLSTALCHLTQIGIEIQRPIEWDGANEQIRNDGQANRMLGRVMRAPWCIS